MRVIRSFFVFCFMAIALVAAAEDPVPISDLHQNDPMGISLLLDQIVTIQGVVTVPTGVFSATRTDVYIQDETGGMAIFSYNPILDRECDSRASAPDLRGVERLL